jgi:hypothetical protein
MARKGKTVEAVAYIRTSSAANVGADKDSDKRQRAAIEGYARRAGFTLVCEFNDAAVSGAATVHITRAKNGTPGNHGLQGEELRLLRALRREHPHADFVFLSERKAPLSVDGAQKLIERLG